jgi:two-component system, OmpR family, phosphate regulon response regulator PhoB
MAIEAGGPAEPRRRTRASSPRDEVDARAPRVLIIERDPESMRPLCGKLTEAGFQVTLLGGAEGAFAAMEQAPPPLVMLDWDMPAVITTQLLRWTRRPFWDSVSRLIAFSNFSGEQHVVCGFEQGVDDYVVKPFSVAEVVARAHAVLRSGQAQTGAPRDHIEFGDLRFDASSNRLAVRDQPVTLRTMELRLLGFLMRHPERPVSRETLLQRVWGRDSRAGLRAVNVTVQRVRQALAPHGCEGYLQSVRGLGYVLSERAAR